MWEDEEFCGEPYELDLEWVLREFGWKAGEDGLL
jgi:hypothetical protein